VLDSIRIRRESYPVRYTYQLFYERYEELHPNWNAKQQYDRLSQHPGTNWRALTETVMNSVLPNLPDIWALYGNTRLFLKMETHGLLEKFRRVVFKRKDAMAAVIQRYWRMTVVWKMRIWVVHNIRRL
jgi:myosin-5